MSCNRGREAFCSLISHQYMLPAATDLMCVLHRYVQAKLKALENEAKIMKDVRPFLHVTRQNLLQ